MENIWHGIFIVILVLIIYYISWYQFKNKHFKKAIILLSICGFLLRIFTATDFFLHTWDERYHALVAKNLIEHPLKPTLYDQPVLPYDYRDWTGNHIWLHKQPLPLWTLAVSLNLFGINELALRLPSIFLSTLAIVITFYLGAYFYSYKVGYFAAFLFSINGLIIELSAGRVATDHIDIFFLFFIELSVFFLVLFVQKKKLIYNILAGISMGCAILTKWLPALIVIPIWLLVILDSKSFKIKTVTLQFIIFVTASILIFLPWQLYIFKTFLLEANWEGDFNYKHFYEVIEERTGSIFYYFNRIRIIFGELIYLPLIWFIWKWLKEPANLKRLAILIWFLIPFLFFSIAKTKMQAYILFTAPALFIMTSEFFFTIKEYKQNSKFMWLYNLVLILLILLPLRYMIERVKPFEKRERNPEWVRELRDLNRNKIQNGVLFNYPRPIEAMFYTDLTVYSQLPDKNIIEDIITKGYNVIINDSANVPDEIRRLENITFYKFK